MSILNIILVIVVIIAFIVWTIYIVKGAINLNDFPDYPIIEPSGDWLEDVEITYIISTITRKINEEKTDWDSYDGIVADYKIGLVNKDDILDTDIAIIPEEIFNSDIYQVGKEVKITKKVIAKD